MLGPLLPSMLGLPHTIGGRLLAPDTSSLLALPPQGGMGGEYKDSIYCWMIYQVGVEDDMVAYMYEHNMGVFACNGQAVIGLYDPSGSVVDTDIGCKFGGHVKTGCKVAKGGPTALPLVFDLSLLPVMDKNGAAFPWIDAMASRSRRRSAKQLALSSSDFGEPIKPRLTAEDTGDETIIAAVRSAEEHFRADGEAASADAARVEAERRSAEVDAGVARADAAQMEASTSAAAQRAAAAQATAAEVQREKSARAAAAQASAAEEARINTAHKEAARAAAAEVARGDSVHAEAAARGEAARAAAAKPDSAPSGTAQEKQDAITKAAEVAAEEAADAAKVASDAASAAGESRAEQARERDAAAAAKDQEAAKQMGEAAKRALQRNRVEQGGPEAAPVKSAAEEELDRMSRALDDSQLADAAAAKEQMDAATRGAQAAADLAGAAAKGLMDKATQSAQKAADASHQREEEAAATTRDLVDANGRKLDEVAEAAAAKAREDSDASQKRQAEVAAGREDMDAANKAKMDAASEQARERTDAARATAAAAADAEGKVREEMTS
jgi:hypothetical protein